MARVLVEVEGGVADVYCDDPTVEITLVDWDVFIDKGEENYLKEMEEIKKIRKEIIEKCTTNPSPVDTL